MFIGNNLKDDLNIGIKCSHLVFVKVILGLKT